MKDVLEITLHVRDIIMEILFAKEIYKVGINLFNILNGIFYKKPRISSYKVKSSTMEYTIFEICCQNLIEITKSLK